MKKTLIAVALMWLLLPLHTAPAKGSEVKAEIDRLLSAWHQAAAKSDIEAYFGVMAEDFVFLGTDVSERWSKAQFRAYAAPAFARPSAWIFRAVRRQISLAADGRSAWFDEDLDSASFWTSRGSGVLEKVAGRWLLKQYVLSFTVPNAAVREVRPIVKKTITGKSEK